MRVHFDNVNLSAQTGPNTFASRLARGLMTAGHELESNGPKADVSLVFIEPSGHALAPKVVQRLDGIWFKPEDFQARNAGIKALYEAADAIVWQSDFDRLMTTKWWGAPGKGLGSIIHNGIDTAPVTRLTIPELAKMRQDFDRIYVCSSNWHPQKRLGANIRLFEHLRQRHPNSCLIIMGSNPDVRVAHPRVFYAGPQPHEVFMQVYSAADWMLHLAWADHCPNVVVEALSQGTPVACAAVGGTRELIGNYGVVLKEQPYSFGLADYDNPPDIDVTQVDDLPARTTLDYSTISDIRIETAVSSYVSLFQELLK